MDCGITYKSRPAPLGPKEIPWVMRPWLSKGVLCSLPIVSWEGFPTLRPDAGRGWIKPTLERCRKIVKCNFNCWPRMWQMTQQIFANVLKKQFSQSPMWPLKLLEVTLNRVKVSWKRSMIGHWSWWTPRGTIGICCDWQVPKLKWLSVSKNSRFPKKLLKGNSLRCSRKIWSQGRVLLWVDKKLEKKHRVLQSTVYLL